MEEIKGPYRFTILPRPAEIGGGWRLRAYETLSGETELEVKGGIFPAQRDDHAAYEQALAAGHEWLATMPKPEHRDAEHYMLGYFARDAAARLGD